MGTELIQEVEQGVVVPGVGLVKARGKINPVFFLQCRDPFFLGRGERGQIFAGCLAVVVPADAQRVAQFKKQRIENTVEPEIGTHVSSMTDLVFLRNRQPFWLLDDDEI